MRFKGTEQLLGAEHFERLARASVCVVGLGGVGSWSVEALARSGVGSLTLVDQDEVCETNINRQVHALSSTIGQSKAQLLAERVSQINPECAVTVINKFFSRKTADEILARGFDVVLDSIDRNENKTVLIGECVRRQIRVVTVGAGGDRTSPQDITIADLARTIYDPLLQIVRKQLRHEYDFPKGERAKFYVPCVYAPKQRGPRTTDASACETDSRGRKSCNDGLGSVVFVTGTLGFIAAGEVIRLLGEPKPSVMYPWVHKSSASSECCDSDALQLVAEERRARLLLLCQPH
jgi:tRNA A37 threonylcarbamoyladenosine dehydratase